MEYSIDRIEEGVAVCESARGEVLHVRAETLPGDAREGSMVSFMNGAWTVLHAQTETVRHELFLMQESLFDE